jgi:N-methylhydantoinase B
MHSHMTNTLNTPAEALEYAYPLQVTRYQFREKKSESKRWSGGVGIQRDLLILSPATASLLSERRAHPPYGLAGGDHGEPGENILIRDGKEIVLPSKGPVDLIPGDILSIRTPGGGSWGNSRDEKE